MPWMGKILSGVYEFPGNTGEGFALAYDIGAELVNLECFQTNLYMKYRDDCWYCDVCTYICPKEALVLEEVPYLIFYVHIRKLLSCLCLYAKIMS